MLTRSGVQGALAALGSDAGLASRPTPDPQVGPFTMGRAGRAGAGREPPRRPRHRAAPAVRTPDPHPHWAMLRLPAATRQLATALAAFFFSLRGVVHRPPRVAGIFHRGTRGSRRSESRTPRGSNPAVSDPALVLDMVDTSTGHRHLVAVEVAALHRRSGRYPALCGEVVARAHLTVPAPACATCVLHAEGRQHRHAGARRALIAKIRGRWRNTG